MRGEFADVIIPARNEQHTIGAVVRAWKSCSNIHQVIVVDNNSTDRTYETAYEAGAYMVTESARGKGQAVAAGLARVTAHRVALCDADLHGFMPHHADLLTQFYPGEIIGSLEWPGRLPKPKILTRYVAMSGQRCLPTALLQSIPLHGYSMETVINAAVAEYGLPVAVVKLHGAHGTLRSGPLRMADVARDRAWLKERFPDGKGKVYR
jgi:Glycosyl transferase family 2